MGKVSSTNKMKVSGRVLSKRPKPAGAIKIDRPVKKMIHKVIPSKPGLDTYVIGSIEIE